MIVVELKWVFSIGEGDGSVIGGYPVEYYTFCNLVVIRGCALGP